MTAYYGKDGGNSLLDGVIVFSAVAHHGETADSHSQEVCNAMDVSRRYVQILCTGCQGDINTTLKQVNR